jgi:hypothetical protein
MEDALSQKGLKSKTLEELFLKLHKDNV